MHYCATSFVSVQYDAAVNPETAKIKLKGKAGAVAGKVYDGPFS